MEGAVEVPPYFLCPISLEIMRDPVTLPTGITYDRENIERWIFSGKHQICPVTKQPLLTTDAASDVVTPNHTLRRLIQGWCAANSSNGVERFPTPRPPLSTAQIAAILEEAKRPATRLAALRKLKAVVAESDRNRRCVEASGAVDVLASIVEKRMLNSVGPEEDELRDAVESTTAAEEEAMSILCSLQLSEKSLHDLMQRDVDFVGLLTKALGRSSHVLQTHSLLLLKSLLPVIPPERLLSLSKEFFREVTKVLRDQISSQATKAALQVLSAVSACGKNRVKAVEAGAVWVLAELLLEEEEKRMSEMMLVTVEQLCRCAEGRAELVGHAAGIAAVGKKIHRVSHLATGMAVKILYTVAKHSAGAQAEMLQCGAVAKMCMMLQMECEEKVKERIREMLKLHYRARRNSLCFAPGSRVSYPSL